MSYPYEFHIALDGNGLNGLEGRAGVCVFRYDPATGRYTYDIRYYPGMAGGHAVSVSPDRRIGFLGSTAQHLMFYDTSTLDEIARVSTLKFEATDSSLKSSTHAVWLSATEVIVAMGNGLWQWDLRRPDKAERIGDHGVELPHALKLTRSRRYLVYGGMDHPGRGEARKVGIFDLHTRTVRLVDLPTTCWHVVCHPTEDRFYALSFRVQPSEGGNDWLQWAIAQYKEYAFEIDAATGQVLRHWSAGQDTPAHVNSDVCISDRELIYCNGASGTVVMIDLETFSSYRLLDERPGFWTRLRASRQAIRTVVDTLTRGSITTSGHHHLRALRVSRGSLIDSVYACQLSADQSLLFTANRGLNTIKVHDYPHTDVRLCVQMPELQAFDSNLRWWGDPRLGFHHSTLLSPSPALPA
jgi:hypothetical protein